MAPCQDAGHLAEDDSQPVRRYRCTGDEGERFVLDLCLPCAEELAASGVVLEDPTLPAKIKEWESARGRIVVTGWPRSGKSTIASRLEAKGITIYHCDILIDTHDWSGASAEIARWLAEPGPWVVEGCAALRGVRKRMLADPGRPCDLLVFTRQPHEVLIRGQESMGKADETRLAEMRPELLRRGVELLEVP